MSRQTEFTEKGVEVMSRDLTPKDLKVMRRWKSTIGQCPWCLRSGDLWSFATFNYRRKKGKTVNEHKCRCPDCGAEVMRRTLFKIYVMTMGEFGAYFWDRVFGGEHDKVSWDALKARLKEEFSYSDVQPFWNAYWSRKEMSLRGWQDEKDEKDNENFMDYMETFGPMEEVNR